MSKISVWGMFYLVCYFVIGFIGRVLRRTCLILFYPLILIGVTLVNMMEGKLPSTYKEFLLPWTYGGLGKIRNRLNEYRRLGEESGYWKRSDLSFGIIIYTMMGIILMILSPVMIPLILYRLGKSELKKYNEGLKHD